MKKLLTLSAVLLAAAMLFTACSNASGGDSDGGGSKGDSGSWSTTAKWYTSGASPVFYNSDNSITCGSFTPDGKGGAVYYNQHPVETKTGSDALKSNQFRFTGYLFMSDYDITGFEGTAKCTSANSSYGFYFNVDEDWKNLYQVVIQGDGVLIKKRINGTTTTIQDWKTDNAIKAEPSENKIKVAKNGKNIDISINGVNVYTITNAETTKGSIAGICGIGYDDILNDTPITATYKITRLQR